MSTTLSPRERVAAATAGQPVKKEVVLTQVEKNARKAKRALQKAQQLAAKKAQRAVEAVRVDRQLAAKKAQRAAAARPSELTSEAEQAIAAARQRFDRVFGRRIALTREVPGLSAKGARALETFRQTHIALTTPPTH